MAEPDTTDDASAPDASAATAARRYLDMLAESERYFQTYNEKADNVDRLYADLERMANTSREREMQVFWANLEVLKPSIYARPPVPVVVPRFKDRKALPRLTAEMLERAVSTSFSTEDIDATMRLIRDDLAVNARGVVWVRYEKKAKSGGAYECVKYDHLDRKDFRHGPARKWSEVPWVARRAYLTRKEGLARFGDAWLTAEFRDRKEGGDDDQQKTEQQAAVWELWHRAENVVVWVTKGVDGLLDKSEPEVTLDGFFPCPRPAYGSLQRGTLKPIPDLLYYKDQIEEINELTARISALAESLRLKGFYAAGASEVGDAVEAALKNQSNNAILVPISNFAALGGTALKDAIVWLPVKDVAEVIKGCIELRRQLIEDVYQVTGLSDIMRGATDPNETLGAQELKSQYGSIRIRDRQAELVRIARDLTRIAGEIMAENFASKTLLEMTQMEPPTDKVIAAQMQQIAAQKTKIEGMVRQASITPAVQQAAQADPGRAKDILAKAAGQIQQLDQQIEKLRDTPTIEKVMAFLRDQRVRPFTLDIETDSTIAPDENAQKQRATEFVTSVGGFMGQVVPLVKEAPQLAPLAAEFLKYVAGQFRAGRELEGAIDEFADQMAQAASTPAPDPAAQAEQAKAQAEQVRAKAEMDAKALEADLKQKDDARKEASAQQDTATKAATAEHQTQLRERESAIKVQGMQADQQRAAEAHAMAKDAHVMAMRKGVMDMRGQAMMTAAKAQAATQSGEGEGGTAQPAEGGPQQPMPDMPEMEFGRSALDSLKFEQTATAALADLGKQNVEIAHALAQLAEAINAPKRVIRDANGALVGVAPVTPQTIQ